MARLTTAARRYAEAALDLARRDGSEDAWAMDLATAAELLSDEEALRVVGSPAVPLPDRDRVVRALLERRVGALALNLVLLLVRRGRVEILPQVAREYARLLRAARGVVEAEVRSATPLDDTELRVIRARLEGMTSSTVELRTEVDPALIGGLAVRLGDRLIDGSVRGRLERLRDQLVAGVR